MTLQNAFADLATEQKQDAGNTSLSSIDTKTPPLESGNVPVILKNTSIEVSNDTGNPLNVDTGIDQPLTDAQLRSAAVPISGTVTANIGTTVTGGNTQFNTLVGANGNAFIDLTDFDIFLAPSDTLTCTSAAISGAATNHVVAINWNEDI